MEELLSIGLGKGPVADCSGHGAEHFGRVRGGEFIGQPSEF